MKPGWKTSELWATIIPSVGVMVLIGIGSITVDEAVQLWPLFVSSGLYSVSRGIAKGGS